MKRFVILCFVILSRSVFAQTAEGGGAYIQRSGKIVNSVILNNYALNGFGVSGTSGGEVTNCSIRNNYYLNTSIVSPGDIVFDDGSVYTPNSSGDLVFPAGYTSSNVIGVCFWSNTNNDYRLGRFWMVAVNEVASMKWAPGVPDNPIDIPDLYNYGDPSITVIDYGGVSNTNLIVNATGHLSYITTLNCAALYCKKYSAGGSSVSWCLPAMGQLRQLELQLTTVNAVLSKLGKTQMTQMTEGYWTSNETTDQEAWSYVFGSSTSWNRKNKVSNPQKVRPIAIIFKSN